MCGFSFITQGKIQTSSCVAHQHSTDFAPRFCATVADGHRAFYADVVVWHFVFSGQSVHDARQSRLSGRTIEKGPLSQMAGAASGKTSCWIASTGEWRRESGNLDRVFVFCGTNVASRKQEILYLEDFQIPVLRSNKTMALETEFRQQFCHRTRCLCLQQTDEQKQLSDRYSVAMIEGWFCNVADVLFQAPPAVEVCFFRCLASTSTRHQ